MFRLFSSSSKKGLIPEKDQALIIEAIKDAEKQTSGEIRVYMEKHCRFVDPVDRAMEVFETLKMHQTKDRNAVLVYIALNDHQLAVFGDEGIHQKVGQKFWEAEVSKMIAEFKADHFGEGVAEVVRDIGEALRLHFPYDRETDKNELPDEIVFGR
ncbi:MAG TPA: TPM domain-containing protein [Parasegetibacter sp.]